MISGPDGVRFQTTCVVDEAIDPFDCIQQSCPQDGMTETTRHRVGRIDIDPQILQAIEEECKSPFTVGVALDDVEPTIADVDHQVPLHLCPAGDVAIVHPHEILVAEGMAVAIRQAAFCGCPHVGEDERRSGLGGQAREIDAVPSRDGGGEDTGIRPQGGGRIVANAKAVAIVRPPAVQTEAGIVGLSEDGMLRR